MDTENRNFSTGRRRWLQRSGLGIGSLALASLLRDEGLLVAAESQSPSFDSIAKSSLAARPPHFPAKAKRVIHLFANGGPSQIDTFDPKPMLEKLHGKPLDSKLISDKRLGGVAHASPFKFSRHGESGIEISELFPNLAKHADDLCVIRSMVTDDPNHPGGCLLMNTGERVLSRPSIDRKSVV